MRLLIRHLLSSSAPSVSPLHLINNWYGHWLLTRGCIRTCRVALKFSLWSNYYCPMTLRISLPTRTCLYMYVQSTVVCGRVPSTVMTSGITKYEISVQLLSVFLYFLNIFVTFRGLTFMRYINLRWHRQMLSIRVVFCWTCENSWYLLCMCYDMLPMLPICYACTIHKDIKAIKHEQYTGKYKHIKSYESFVANH